MERTEHIYGSAETRGCGPLRRVLTQFGLQILGLSEQHGAHEEACWWDDAERAARARAMGRSLGSRPAETRVMSNRVTRARPVQAPVLERDSDDTLCVEILDGELQCGAAGSDVDESTIGFEKGGIMSALKVGRFLRISGSIYDGNDEGRWLALPGSRRKPQYQLTKDSALFREARDGVSVPSRTFSGVIRRWGDCLGL
ncbi:MAG TPA: hypothetical protein PLE77_04610 [Kiritimatiellia bacterium]|nr:hypothetical protein [Kiritimatiellia bacterium]